MKKICATKAWKTVEKAWGKTLAQEQPQVFVHQNGVEVKVVTVSDEQIKLTKRNVRWNLRKMVTKGTCCINKGHYYMRVGTKGNTMATDFMVELGATEFLVSNNGYK